MSRPPLPVILLAAGQSSRWGCGSKLAHPLDGVPMLRRVAETYRAADVGDLFVVTPTGRGGEEVRGLLDGLSKIRFVENPDAALGIGSSVRAGFRALLEADGGDEGFLVTPGDLPFVQVGSVAAVVHAFRAASGRLVIVPTCRGIRGHPVAIPGHWLLHAADIPDERGAAALFTGNSESVLEIKLSDPGIIRDCDRPSDLFG